MRVEGEKSVTETHRVEPQSVQEIQLGPIPSVGKKFVRSLLDSLYTWQLLEMRFGESLRIELDHKGQENAIRASEKVSVYRQVLTTLGQADAAHATQHLSIRDYYRSLDEKKSTSQ